MLFVLVMEVLNHCLHWVEQRGLLTPIRGIEDSLVSLYADDLVLFVVPVERDLEVIKVVLTIFGLVSGLFSNLDKSAAMPLNCTDQDIQQVQSRLACQVEGSPIATLASPYPSTS